MIGLVNRAIKEVAEGLLGPDGWPQVRERIDWDLEAFVGLDHYDDEVAHEMVSMTSQAAQIPGEAILKAAGARFFNSIVPETFGPLSDLLGHSLAEALENLDTLHARMSLSLTNVDLPRFQYNRRSDEIHELTYDSARPFLVPFICGILQALAQLFDLGITIESRELSDQHAIHLTMTTHAPSTLPTHTRTYVHSS